ncbi:MAG: aminoglycoside phosphotransferase, partial [Actinomycetia bacterium]|nr:aminoglycoside phosphotransferase [Actinomycetes bacterium]
GGLPVDQWSILWHRAWIIEWYLSQATTWISDPATDTTYQRVIRRHLAEALACLNTPTS